MLAELNLRGMINTTSMAPTPLQNLEALLYYYGEPVSVRTIAGALKLSEEATLTLLTELRESLAGRGVTLILENGTATLATAPETRELIEATRKDELETPLGKAGYETLAIIVYRGPLSKADIEYIRGVNSSSILRSLTMRGLIQKIEHPTDRRSSLYQGTPELFAHLGLQAGSDAPNFETITSEIQALLTEQEGEAT